MTGSNTAGIACAARNSNSETRTRFLDKRWQSFSDLRNPRICVHWRSLLMTKANNRNINQHSRYIYPFHSEKISEQRIPFSKLFKIVYSYPTKQDREEIFCLFRFGLFARNNCDHNKIFVIQKRRFRWYLISKISNTFIEIWFVVIS